MSALHFLQRAPTIRFTENPKTMHNPAGNRQVSGKAPPLGELSAKLTERVYKLPMAIAACQETTGWHGCCRGGY